MFEPVFVPLTTYRDALAPLDANENKPYLETAPYLIVIFADHEHANESGIYEREGLAILAE